VPLRCCSLLCQHGPSCFSFKLARNLLLNDGAQFTLHFLGELRNGVRLSRYRLEGVHKTTRFRPAFFLASTKSFWFSRFFVFSILSAYIQKQNYHNFEEGTSMH
jgi:hypothetical protein